MAIVLYIFIFIFQIFFGTIIFLFKRPVLLDFLGIWTLLGVYLAFECDNVSLNGWQCTLIGFLVALVVAIIMIKVKYIGWLLIALMGAFWGYHIFKGVDDLLIHRVPNASFYISCFAGIAFFIHHLYFGIVQSQELFGDYYNPFGLLINPFKKLYYKIRGIDYIVFDGCIISGKELEEIENRSKAEKLDFSRE